SAKGLEFDVVFLPGWEDGLFPHQRALDESGAAGLEEERRLAYVGLTRARHKVVVSYAARRGMHGLWQDTLPSRFIAGRPAAHADAMAAMGRAAGRGADGWGYAPQALRPGRGRGGDVLIEGEAWPAADDSAAYRVGARVFHRKFGYGSVTAAES